MEERSTNVYVDIERIARKVVREVGYTNISQVFIAETCNINVAIIEQSKDIAVGVNNSLEVKMGSENEKDCNGAGNYGMMFGYASDEIPELMPLSISLFSLF